MYEYSKYLGYIDLVVSLPEPLREWVAYRMLRPAQRKKLRRLMPDEFPKKAPKYPDRDAIVEGALLTLPGPSKGATRRLPRVKYDAAVRAISEANKLRVPGAVLRRFTTMHMDHIVPVLYGFQAGIPPELMGSPANLQMLPAPANWKKGDRLTDQAVALLEEWGYM